MSESPILSVLMPTYNYGRFIGEAIDSVLRQDFSDYELLVSDDCSTDDTMGRLESIAGVDGRIRVHKHSKNQGMVANWNWCLREARGKYVLFLFADDYLRFPGALATLMEPLMRDPTLAMCASARMLVTEAGVPQIQARDLEREGRYSGDSVISRCLAEVCNLVGEPSAVIMRRDLALRGFDPGYRQLVDLEMWFYLARQGGVYFVNRPLVAFRRHGSQQTAVNSRDVSTRMEIYRLLADYLPPSEMEGKSRREKTRYAVMCYELQRQMLRVPELAVMAKSYRGLLDEGMRLHVGGMLPFWYRIFKISLKLRISIKKRLRFVV
ncbi:MAG: glycosyltransferase family 2 protein [Rhodocyclaceae bacterium]|nr:MAG: glycosyltransferase family 2 protein [Rhodocyclaceae bacterium]